ncbi:MAG TPA: carbohydrate kinase family protein [Thermoleophilaceae bacterium]
MKTVALGAYILDVLVRPVTEIPAGQDAALVEEIRLAPAGAAGGTAVTLAKLGADVHAAGAVGRDTLGDVLIEMLEQYGVHTDRLARRDDLQTSSSVIPIRPTGERPALHVIGANLSYTPGDAPLDLIAAADFLHVGGPELLGETAELVLKAAKDAGATTSVDVLADGWPELLDMIAPALPYVDWITPNDEQAKRLTGEADIESAAAVLIELGAGGVIVTCGADGVLIVTPDGQTRVPAFEIEVIDTSGCGDAFVAGFLRGLSLGERPADAARLGSATAALVAQGTGSDHGEFDLQRVQAFASSTPMREPAQG